LVTDKLSEHGMNIIGDEKAFNCIDGSRIKSLLELADSLGDMSDDSYYYHVVGERNDFARWVREVFNEEALAGSIQRTGNRNEAQAKVLRHIIGRIL
jgi:hypothetical protein